MVMVMVIVIVVVVVVVKVIVIVIVIVIVVVIVGELTALMDLGAARGDVAAAREVLGDMRRWGGLGFRV